VLLHGGRVWRTTEDDHGKPVTLGGKGREERTGDDASPLSPQPSSWEEGMLPLGGLTKKKRVCFLKEGRWRRETFMSRKEEKRPRKLAKERNEPRYLSPSPTRPPRVATDSWQGWIACAEEAREGICT